MASVPSALELELSNRVLFCQWDSSKCDSSGDFRSAEPWEFPSATAPGNMNISMSHSAEIKPTIRHVGKFFLAYLTIVNCFIS